MHTASYDADLIVALDRAVGYLGIPNENAALIVADEIHEGRSALYALMSLENDAADAERSFDYGQYPRSMRSLVRDGRLHVHYLINCPGMACFFVDNFKRADDYIQKRGGTISTYASHNALSGGAFRLAAADIANRHVMERTSILLHLRQRDSEPVLFDPKSADDFHEDMEMIEHFFRDAPEGAHTLKQEALYVCGNQKDMEFSGREMHDAGLAKIVESADSMKSLLLQQCTNIRHSALPGDIQRFFRRKHPVKLRGLEAAINGHS